MTAPRVLVLRGAQANPWDLQAWAPLRGRFDVHYLAIRSNLHEIPLDAERIPALSDAVPVRPARRLAAVAPVNRYLGLDSHLASADIVHAAELASWFTAQAATRKRRHKFRLVVTVWETIPFGTSYRNRLSVRNRARALAGVDLFLPTTARARDALLLEGVPAQRCVVSPPGVDIERFATAVGGAAAPDEHLVVSPGRLVWEKGHQDVLRAIAALMRGIVAAPALPRLLIVGAGPEEMRLRAYARELGVADRVNLRQHVPYDEMPAIYAQASAIVLASLPAQRWEEQFGMVLAESMAAGLPVLASTSGAIPEVAPGALPFAPGDWLGLARALAGGPLARPPGERKVYPDVERYSSNAAADRLAAVYARVLAE